MCGIAGRAGNAPRDPNRLGAMVDSLTHRGPDEDGTHLGDNIELGMRRLSIIDVAHGHQPVSDENERFHLVFNGEIYNFQELRTNLEKKGHTFKSSSDSEVIVHTFEEFGVETFKLLRGMFAIAIWDSQQDTLYLARDHIGKKPLVYATTLGNIFFGSETRAVFTGLKMSGIKPSIDPVALNNFLYRGYVPSPKNAFSEIRSLQPGSYLIWKENEFQEKKFWSPEYEIDSQITYQDALEQTENLIISAVSRRMISERPLGTFLSGGVDSSLVTAIASSIASEQVSTFTIGFSQRKYDESENAAEIARYLGTNHHEFKEELDPVKFLIELGESFDQPFADSSAIPTMLLSQRSRSEVVVALSGDGGDEIFMGYERYKFTPKLQSINGVLSVVGLLNKPLSNWASKSGHRKLLRLTKELHSEQNLAARYSNGMSLLNLNDRSSLMSDDFKSHLQSFAQPESDYLSLIESISDNSEAKQLAIADILSYLPDDLLVKVDIASMRHSLEVRAPLLDLDLIEFALTLPQEIHMRNGVSKSILKDILAKYVPKNLFDRPKMGFAIPRAHWLRNELHEMSHDLLLDATAKSRGWTNTNEVEKLLIAHDRGNDLDSKIWPLLCLELWARNWLDVSPAN